MKNSDDFTTKTAIGRVRIKKTGEGNWIVRKGKKIVARIWLNPLNQYAAKGEHQGAQEWNNICGLTIAAQRAVED